MTIYTMIKDNFYPEQAEFRFIILSLGLLFSSFGSSIVRAVDFVWDTQFEPKLCIFEYFSRTIVIYNQKNLDSKEQSYEGDCLLLSIIALES